MTYRHKKIPVPKNRGYGPAADIAAKIAHAAFERLIVPLEKKRDDLALRMYQHLLDCAGVTQEAAIELGVVGLAYLSDNILMEVADANGNTKRIWARSDKETFLSDRNVVEFTNAAFYDELALIERELDPLYERRNDMLAALCEQIEGRSTKVVMETWPEAAHIVAEVMDLRMPAPMIRPLDALLSKFLPMLPAPK